MGKIGSSTSKNVSKTSTAKKTQTPKKMEAQKDTKKTEATKDAKDTKETKDPKKADYSLHCQFFLFSYCSLRSLHFCDIGFFKSIKHVS